MSNTKIYTSAPLELVIAVEERVEKEINDVKNFNNSGNNITETIKYFKGENQKSGKKVKPFRYILEFFTHNFSATTSTFVNLSVT